MAKIHRIDSQVPQIIGRKRVAAYARVSMETELLMHSLSAQVSHYSSLIQSNPEWEYVGVYVDEGITGTSTKHRDDFKLLLKDCDAGKIDLVIVKSISRFARDTVDTLEATRHLKNLGIDVYFERENIHSMSSEGELLLTLLASFAQEESRSISENVKWGVRKRFKEGIPNGNKAPYGYEWDGEMYRIIPEQGEIVKEIFRRYLDGEPAYSIAKDLRQRGIVGQSGKPLVDSSIKDMVTNSSYTGKLILQKWFFTENHTRRRNKGELPRYVVEEMFEPLVSEEDYLKATVIRRERADEMPNKNPQLTVFSGKVKCGTCGCSVSRRTTNNGKKWCCNKRERKGVAECDMRPVMESELEKAKDQIGAFESITIFDDCLEFELPNGKTRSIYREYGGYKGRNGFSGKICCGNCGGKYERDNWAGKFVWKCSKNKDACDSKRVHEDELRQATMEIIGADHYEPRFVRLIDKVLVFDDRLEFYFKRGDMVAWQRK